jgi:hypothetical protein
MFYDYHKKAEKKLKENVQQAIEYYRSALKYKPPLSYKPTRDNKEDVLWNDYFSVKIEFGGVLRD